MKFLQAESVEISYDKNHLRRTVQNFYWFCL